LGISLGVKFSKQANLKSGHGPPQQLDKFCDATGSSFTSWFTSARGPALAPVSSSCKISRGSIPPGRGKLAVPARSGCPSLQC
jgi:hypothetical protein